LKDLEYTRPPGRPQKPLFDSPEAEQHCIALALSLVEQCYQPQAETPKKPFCVPHSDRCSVRGFWALYYLYMVRQKLMNENQEAFCDLLRHHLPNSALAVRREDLSKALNKLRSNRADTTYDLEALLNSDQHRIRQCEKYRATYRAFTTMIETIRCNKVTKSQ